MLKEAQKAREEERSERECLCARFPGLVDLVLNGSQIKYLIVKDGDLALVDSCAGENGKVLRPPDLEAL
jgi:hypothetical protein